METYPDIEVRFGRTQQKEEELTKEARNVYDYLVSKKELKLKTGDIRFYIIDDNSIASQAAFSVYGFDSWMLGQQYFINKGMIKIFEMVDRSKRFELEDKEYIIAFLNRGNELPENISTISHVFGHAHVMRNNYLSKHSEVSLDKLLDLRQSMEELEKKIGVKEVEKIIEIGDTLDSLQDYYPDLHKDRDIKYTDSIPERDTYDIAHFVIENARMPQWKKEAVRNVLSFYQSHINSRIKVIHESFSTFVQYNAIGYYSLNPGITTKMLQFLNMVASPAYLFTSLIGEGTAQIPYSLYNLFERMYKENQMSVYSVVAGMDDVAFLRNYLSKEFVIELLEGIIKNPPKLYSIIEQMEARGLPTSEDAVNEVVLKIILSKLLGWDDEKTNNSSLDGLIYNIKYHYDDYLFSKNFKDPITLLLVESTPPILYIPAGGYSNDYLRVIQYLPLSRYLDEDNYTEDELKKIRAYFTVNNKSTLDTFKLVSSLLGSKIKLQTFDPKDGSEKEIEIKA
ncbi:MAG: SpoVR family protein [Conexivisphaerales archaeon]